MKLTPEEREWKSLVIARYNLFPYGLKLCVGKHALTHDQILTEIQRETELGRLLIRVEKTYLQSLKNINFKEVLNGES